MSLTVLHVLITSGEFVADTRVAALRRGVGVLKVLSYGTQAGGDVKLEGLTTLGGRGEDGDGLTGYGITFKHGGHGEFDAVECALTGYDGGLNLIDDW
jgi:hypothetical protein